MQFGDMQVKKLVFKLDLAEFQQNYFAAQQRLRDKYILQWLVDRISEHQVQMVATISGAHREFTKEVPQFYSKLLEGYRQSLRTKSLFGFWTANRIEKKASELAWQDIDTYAQTISALYGEVLEKLIAGHQSVLQQIVNNLEDLLQQYGPITVELNPDAVHKLIEG